MQRSAARHKYLEVWTVRYHFFEAERLRDGRQDEFRVADLGQGDKTDATRKVVEEFGCHLHSQARFADATGAGERQQANIWAPQEHRDGPYIVLTPDERRERYRETIPGQRCALIWRGLWKRDDVILHA